MFRNGLILGVCMVVMTFGLTALVLSVNPYANPLHILPIGAALGGLLYYIMFGRNQ